MNRDKNMYPERGNFILIIVTYLFYRLMSNFIRNDLLISCYGTLDMTIGIEMLLERQNVILTHHTQNEDDKSVC